MYPLSMLWNPLCNFSADIDKTRYEVSASFTLKKPHAKEKLVYATKSLTATELMSLGRVDLLKLVIKEAIQAHDQEKMVKQNHMMKPTPANS